MRAATVVQVLQDLFYVLLHVYFTCDRSLKPPTHRRDSTVNAPVSQSWPSLQIPVLLSYRRWWQVTNNNVICEKVINRLSIKIHVQLNRYIIWSLASFQIVDGWRDATRQLSRVGVGAAAVCIGHNIAGDVQQLTTIPTIS